MSSVNIKYFIMSFCDLVGKMRMKKMQRRSTKKKLMLRFNPEKPVKSEATVTNTRTLCTCWVSWDEAVDPD